MTQHHREIGNLKFSEHEFVEFFGVVGPLDEDAFSYNYALARDGLRLEFTIFPLDGGVYTSIFRDGIDEPIISIRLDGCTHSRFFERGAHRCLEIGKPEHPTTEPSVPLVWGLRLFVDPHFKIEFINEVN